MLVEFELEQCTKVSFESLCSSGNLYSESLESSGSLLEYGTPLYFAFLMLFPLSVCIIDVVFTEDTRLQGI